MLNETFESQTDDWLECHFHLNIDSSVQTPVFQIIYQPQIIQILVCNLMDLSFFLICILVKLLHFSNPMAVLNLDTQM